MAEPIPLPSPQQIVTIRALLIPLMRVSGLVVVLGVVFAVDALTRAFFGTVSGTLGWVPYLNRVIQQPIHSIQKKVSSYLGGLESHIDASMGGYLHALADGIGRLASGEAEAGWAAWAIAKSLRALRYTVHALPSPGKVVTITKTVYVQTKAATAKAAKATAVAVRAAPASLVRKVEAVAGAIEGVIEWDLPRLRERTRAAEQEIGRLWRYVRKRAVPIGIGAGVGAIAFALGRLGLGWLRCSRVGKAGRSICGMDQGLLESLLADSLLIVGSLSLVEFAREMVDVTDAAVRPIQSFWRIG